MSATHLTALLSMYECVNKTKERPWVRWLGWRGEEPRAGVSSQLLSASVGASQEEE